MSNKDIRWQQRFANYQKALDKLREVVEGSDTTELSDLEKEGMIQRFEYSYELAWKTLQDYLRNAGYPDIAGPKDVISQAYKDGIITDGESWKKMKLSRELTSHTYNSETAEEIAFSIVDEFFYLLESLENFFLDKIKSNQTDLFDE